MTDSITDLLTLWRTKAAEYEAAGKSLTDVDPNARITQSEQYLTATILRANAAALEAALAAQTEQPDWHARYQHESQIIDEVWAALGISTIEGADGKHIAQHVRDLKLQVASLAALQPTVEKRCPRCDSPAPHLHPAVQFEGEVSICQDPWHSQITNQNPPFKFAAARPAPQTEPAEYLKRDFDSLLASLHAAILLRENGDTKAAHAQEIASIRQAEAISERVLASRHAGREPETPTPKTLLPHGPCLACWDRDCACECATCTRARRKRS